MKEIWLVYGKSGEYSDCKEWVVGAFLNEQNAAKAVIRLKQESAEVAKKYESGDIPSWDLDAWAVKQGFLDAQNFRWGWYDDSEYGYYKVNVLDLE